MVDHAKKTDSIAWNLRVSAETFEKNTVDFEEKQDATFPRLKTHNNYGPPNYPNQNYPRRN